MIFIEWIFKTNRIRTFFDKSKSSFAPSKHILTEVRLLKASCNQASRLYLKVILLDEIQKNSINYLRNFAGFTLLSIFQLKNFHPAKRLQNVHEIFKVESYWKPTPQFRICMLIPLIPSNQQIWLHNVFNSILKIPLFCTISRFKFSNYPITFLKLV